MYDNYTVNTTILPLEMSELFPARGLLRSLVVLDGLAAALLLLLRLALAVLQALLQLGRRRACVRRRQRAVLRARGEALIAYAISNTYASFLASVTVFMRRF